MQVRTQYRTAQQRLLWSKRHVPAVLLTVLLVLQSVVPASAAASGDGDLIEICSEFGVLLVRIDDSGNMTDPGDATCPKCGDCPLCAIIAFGNLPKDAACTKTTTLGHRLLSAVAQPHTDNPARFWADNRGPPPRIQKATDLATRQFVGLPCSEGRAPWI